MELGLATRQEQRFRASLSDLDFVATGPEAIDPGAARAFLVSHYHTAQADVPRFMAQFVDSNTRVRIDVFEDVVGSVETSQLVSSHGVMFKALSLESVFEHKLRTLRGASRRTPVDPKHYRDARALGSILRREIPLIEASALVPDVYGIECGSECRRCELSRNQNFPLASKHQILDLLGYV